MKHLDLAYEAAAAILSGTQMSLVRQAKTKMPAGFPRGELVCENFDGTRVYRFDPVRVLKWLRKTGLLADEFIDTATAAERKGEHAKTE